MERSKPNILITGTPGTGKTSTASTLARATGLHHVEVGALVKQNAWHEGRDEHNQCFIIDEDAVVDGLEDQMTEGGNIVDMHSCEFFPERWFDLVVVLRTDNTVLYPRLENRGYPQHKISENIECEIMQVILEEARESYREEIVWELQSDSVEDMDKNVERLQQWVSSWDPNA